MSDDDDNTVDLEQTEMMVRDLLSRNQRLSETLSTVQSAYDVLLRSHPHPQCGVSQQREIGELALDGRGHTIEFEQ